MSAAYTAVVLALQIQGVGGLVQYQGYTTSVGFARGIPGFGMLLVQLFPVVQPALCLQSTVIHLPKSIP